MTTDDGSLLAFLAEWMPGTHEDLASGAINQSDALDTVEHDLAIWCQDEYAHQLPEIDAAYNILRQYRPSALAVGVRHPDTRDYIAKQNDAKAWR